MVAINGKKLAESYIKPDRRDTQTQPARRIPQGHYFMMGDNRSSSCDSRSWGPITRGEIIGEVFFIYWPPNRISFVGAAAALGLLTLIWVGRRRRDLR